MWISFIFRTMSTPEIDEAGIMIGLLVNGLSVGTTRCHFEKLLT